MFETIKLDEQNRKCTVLLL